MIQKKTILVLALAISALFSNAQVKGNYDYRNVSNNVYIASSQAPRQYDQLPMQALGDLTFSIKGLYNAKPDSYLAIFTSTQVGKTQKETNQLLKQKLDSIRSNMTNLGIKAELFVDMISFIPLYEVAVEKKLFSKNTYNEIPIGFELKKNLHFKYTDPQMLEALVTLCAEQEIYDLVRVDYSVDDIEAKKAKLIADAEKMIRSKIARFGALSQESYNDKDRLLAEGFAIHYPHEQYQSYQAYCSNAISFKAGTPQQAPKTVSQFYMPKLNKNYDFVINPSILDPVVQIEYEIRVKLVPKPEKPVEKQEPKEVIKKEIVKDIYIVTPNGDVKKLNL